jgi:hypothetical protein
MPHLESGSAIKEDSEMCIPNVVLDSVVRFACGVLVLAIMLGLGQVPVARADTPSFVFNVPVSLAKVHHSVEKVLVYCDVGIAGVGHAGSGAAEIPRTGGTALVTINTLPDMDPALVTQWVCSLRFVIDGNVYSVWEDQSKTHAGLNAVQYKAEPGTPIHTYEKGQF